MSYRLMWEVCGTIAGDLGPYRTDDSYATLDDAVRSGRFVKKSISPMLDIAGKDAKFHVYIVQEIDLGEKS